MVLASRRSALTILPCSPQPRASERQRWKTPLESWAHGQHEGVKQQRASTSAPHISGCDATGHCRPMKSMRLAMMWSRVAGAPEAAKSSDLMLAATAAAVAAAAAAGEATTARQRVTAPA
jgi:hypothetical protein